MYKKRSEQQHDEFRNSKQVNNVARKPHESAVGVTGICVLCAKPSVCVCARCGDYYCSPDCQRTDWHRHRYICFPMPALAPANLFAATALAETRPLLASSAIPKNEVQKKPSMHASPVQQQQGPSRHTSGSVNGDTDAQYNNNKQRTQKPTMPLTIPVSPLPKANSRVLLTGFRTPNRCYVRSLTQEDDEGYNRVVRKVDEYGKTAPPLSKMPKPNSYAITDRGGVMYRVQILAVRQNGIRVLFCDHGTTGKRQFHELRQISDQIILLQQYPVMLQLRHVENYAINNRLTNFLSKFEDSEFKIAFAEDDERSGSVELFDWKSEEMLNKEIVKFCSDMDVYSDGGIRKSDSNAGDSTANTSAIGNGISPTNGSKSSNESITVVQAAPNQIQMPVLTPPFKTHTLAANATNIKAVVLDNSGLTYGFFGCIAESDLSHLAAVQKFLTELEDNDTPYKPKMNEYCIAKFEDEWYRAKVTDVSKGGTEYTVMYVDFTNESTVTSSDIRRYPSELTVDCRTQLCLIDGLDSHFPLNEKQEKFVKNEIKFQSKITIDQVKAIEDQCIIIECRSLIVKMHDLGLI